MARTQTQEQKPYVKILSSDGTFRLEVPEGTEGAVKREYEVDGVKGTKNEIIYSDISGHVTNVETVDTKFGTLIQVTVTDEEGDLVISTSAANNFGSDLMKKLPGMDFAKMYKFTPYAFTPEGKDKPLRGVSIMDDMEVKVKSFFQESDKEGKFVKTINGLPEPKKDVKYTTNKWKAFFGEVEDFLVEYTEKNVATKFEVVEEVQEDINPDDVDI